MKALSMFFLVVACTPDAREDMHEAQKALEKTGVELGQAAQKTAERMDDRAEAAGDQLSAELDQARQELAKAKETADRAGDLYMDPAQGEEAGAVRCAAEHYAIDRAMLDRAIANPLAVAGATSFEPVAGKGYRLTRIDPESPVAKLDVRVGDILVSVDGRDVETLDGNSLVNRLRQAEEVSFTVERGGEDVRKTVAIES